MSANVAQDQAPGGTDRFFTRQATGLVREVTWVDAAIYNLIWSSVPLSIAFILAFGPAFYIGANLVLATVLAFGRGLRGFMRFQRWAVVVSYLVSVVLPLAVRPLVGHDTLTANFVAYATSLGGAAGAYDAYAAAGKFASPAVDLGETLLTVTLAYYTLGFIFQSAYFGGEIKQGARNTLLAIPGAQVIAVVMILASIAVFQPVSDLLAGTGAQLFGTDMSKTGFAFAPLYTEVAAIASGNLIVGLFITVATLLLFMLFVPQTMILLSRSLFAWSFDRLLPDPIAEVKE